MKLSLLIMFVVDVEKKN